MSQAGADAGAPAKPQFCGAKRGLWLGHFSPRPRWRMHKPQFIIRADFA
jgi:hypothetical protein